MFSASVPPHRVTTAHLSSLYPWAAENGLGPRGVYIGTDHFGGGSFCYDPWELYATGVLTNPNMIVIGDLGFGKSGLVKSYVWRQLAFGRQAWMLDPKGENDKLCAAAGVAPILLAPGGSIKLNPLDSRAGRAERPEAHELLQDQVGVLCAIVGAALRRSLTAEERTGCEVALRDAMSMVPLGHDPTLANVVEAILEPSTKAAQTAHTTAAHLKRSNREVGLELRRLVEGDLRGMFDGETAGDIDVTAPLISFDLSAMYHSDALPILMTCVAAWFNRALHRSRDKRKRVVVFDEVWALFLAEVLRLLRAWFKFARAVGVQYIAVAHRLSDLAAAGRQGSEEERLARGLLSDSQTRIVYCQPSDQIAETRALLRLTGPQADTISQLYRGLALWLVGQRSFLVEHVVRGVEWDIVDTDERMAVDRA